MEVKKVRKRPDVSQRYQERKTKDERVVKCSLPGHLIEKRLMPEIQSWVRTTSKIANKGSLVFNRWLLHCLQHEIPLPDLTDQMTYLQCFTIGIAKLRKPNDVLQQVWDTHFRSFPSISRCKGDSQAYAYASKTYMTNFKNSLIFAFENRQKGYISKWCEINGIHKKHTHAIRCYINKWECRAEVPQEAYAFAEEQRETLGVDDRGLTRRWLETNMQKIVLFLSHSSVYETHSEWKMLFSRSHF